MSRSENKNTSAGDKSSGHTHLGRGFFTFGYRLSSSQDPLQPFDEAGKLSLLGLAFYAWRSQAEWASKERIFSRLEMCIQVP